MRSFPFLLGIWACFAPTTIRPAEAPVRFAIVGLVHDHARGFIPSAKSRKDIQLVAIVEPNQQLARSYAERYQLESGLFHTNLEDMLEKANVQAVATFTSTFDHTKVVETCAARGVHVMMEKPLAVNMEHALRMEAAAKKGGIHLLVNYETTWYPANHEAYSQVHEKHAIGELRKIVVHDGHQGPKEIGCSEAFLEWLTDPVLNGGGALTDFGCYGANLITWLMEGQRPTSVFAVTQQIKPEVYPKVDDRAQPRSRHAGSTISSSAPNRLDRLRRSNLRRSSERSRARLPLGKRKSLPIQMVRTLSGNPSPSMPTA